MTPASPSRISSAARTLSRDEFRDVIGHFASGVTVITVESDGMPFGTTASAVSSLSLDPPMVLICMNESSTTGRAVAAAEAFAINILQENQSALARRFATKGDDKFAGVAVSAGPFGQPLIAEALATIECSVVEAVTGGTHTVFLGEVRSATSREGSPLAYFRGEFGRLELSRDSPLYSTIRARLLARELPVGRQLEVDELAEGLDAPAGPLYYALGRLSTEGMLEQTATGGFRVPPVTVQTVDDAVDACCAIELGAIDLSIGRVDSGDVDTWRSAMEATLEHVSPGHFIDLDTSIDASFHEMLIGFTGSASLLASYRQVALSGILARAFEPRLSRTATDLAYGQDHRDIFETFAAGDAPEARQAIVRHGERIKRAFRATKPS
jgi:flavin reductase (DIM6/NTAB) family NADH-FMN oxidoreductase RutF/DNA-binding GntR family transcriptional regulator